MKSVAFHFSPKFNHAFGLLLIETMSPRTFKNHPIWSHCSLCMVWNNRPMIRSNDFLHVFARLNQGHFYGATLWTLDVGFHLCLPPFFNSDGLGFESQAHHLRFLWFIWMIFVFWVCKWIMNMNQKFEKVKFSESWSKF